MATIGVSALGIALMMPANGPATIDIAQMAAIDESSTTLGFADSDMFGLTPAQVDQHLDQMQAMGVNNVRIMIPWAAVEFYPDAYDYSMVDYMVNAADSRGMGVLAVLNSSPYWAVPEGQPGISGQPENPADYAEFVGQVAERYQGKVGAYEIWNEPNSALSFAPSPDPVAYTELLQAAYPVIKAADPDAIVVGGVTGAVVDYGNILKNPVSFTQEMYDAGAAGYFDALSFHPYLYSLPFSQGAPYPESPLTQVERMRQIMVANGDADKLIWATEYGEPTSVVDEATQAAYLDDMVTAWRDLGYTGPAFVYTLYDRDSSSTVDEATLGVIRSDGTWKPAAYVIQDLAEDPDTVQLAAAMSRMSLAPATETALAPGALPVTGPVDPAAVPAVAAPAPTNPAEAVAASVAALADAFNQAAAQALGQVNAMVQSMAAPAVTPADATPTAADPVTAPSAVPAAALAPTALAPTASDSTNSPRRQSLSVSPEDVQAALRGAPSDAPVAPTAGSSIPAPVEPTADAATPAGAADAIDETVDETATAGTEPARTAQDRPAPRADRPREERRDARAENRADRRDDRGDRRGEDRSDRRGGNGERPRGDGDR